MSGAQVATTRLSGPGRGGDVAVSSIARQRRGPRSVRPAPRDPVDGRAAPRDLPHGRRVDVVRRHLRFHEDVRAARSARQGRGRGGHRRPRGDLRAAARRRVRGGRQPAEVRRRRAAAVVLGGEPRGEGGMVGPQHAGNAPGHRPARNDSRQGPPADVIGGAHRLVPLLPRRGLASGAHRHRTRGESDRPDGGDRDRGRDPRQPGDRRLDPREGPRTVEGRGDPAEERAVGPVHRA